MASRLWVPVASRPLAQYAAGYGSWLAGRGYSRWAVSRRLWQLDLLSRWLEREWFSPGELTMTTGHDATLQMISTTYYTSSEIMG